MWLLSVAVLTLASAGASDDLPRSPLLAPGSSWQKVAGGLGFGEGPAWHPDGLGRGRGIDGMTLDADGRIWATAGTKEKAGIYVFMPDAKRGTARLVTFVAMDEDPTNCTFGGPGRDMLYVTTTSSLYRIRTTVRGQKSPPGK